jgi:hypothetical protein
MRHLAMGVLVTAVLLGTGSGTVAGDAQATIGAQRTPGEAAGRTTWYFYRVKWGHQFEFLQLFQKNHYPLLKAQLDAGRFTSVKTYVPRYHGDGRADWTFAVELVEAANPPAGPSEQELIKKLYPDEATYRKEEARRFELLEAHWDSPLAELDLSRPLDWRQ